MCATALCRVGEAVEQASPFGAFAHGMRRFRRRREVHDGREIGRTEERHRVDVGVAGAQAEVQHRVRRDLRPCRRSCRRRRPLRTVSPRRTATDARNEYDVRRLPACAITTWRVPATVPANDTTPGPAATTGVPGTRRGRRRDGRRRNATRARRTGGRPRPEPAGPIHPTVRGARRCAGTSSATTNDETRTNLRTFPPGVHEDDSGKEEGRPGNLGPPATDPRGASETHTKCGSETHRRITPPTPL